MAKLVERERESTTWEAFKLKKFKAFRPGRLCNADQHLGNLFAASSQRYFGNLSGAASKICFFVAFPVLTVLSGSYRSLFT